MRIRIFRQLFQFVIFFQFLLFIMFVLEHITQLGSIQFDLSILGSSYDFNINFYAIIGIIAIFYGIVLLLSINVFGFGLNEEGSKNVSRLVSLIAIITVLALTNSYYVLQFGFIGLLIEIMILIVYLFYAIDSINAYDEE